MDAGWSSGWTAGLSLAADSGPGKGFGALRSDFLRPDEASLPSPPYRLRSKSWAANPPPVTLLAGFGR